MAAFPCSSRRSGRRGFVITQRAARHVLIGALCSVTFTTPSAAQPSNRPGTAQSGGALRGTAVSSTGTPLEGVQLRITFGSLSVAPRAESDEAGNFQFAGINASPVWVHARRLGYRPDSVLVELPAQGPATVRVALERAVVELSAVRVIGRRDIVGPMAGFYQRQSTGNGRFFTSAEIDRRNASRLTDLLRDVPGLRIEARGMQNVIRIRGARCSPLIWLDGQALMSAEVDMDAWDTRTFEGIEVYSGPAGVPVEFQRNARVSSSCGTIILWSRMGEFREPRRKKGEPTPAARIATLLEEGKTFVPTDVDAPATPDSGVLVRPVYPDSLYEAAVGGRVIAEVVVGTNGQALMETFSAVTTTHRGFVEPVRRALREQRFTPAVRRGSVVQQVLQLPFEFVPDSTARRRK